MRTNRQDEPLGEHAAADARANADAPPPQRKARRRGAQIVLAGWFVGSTLVASTLLARHVVPLPRPDADVELATALAPLRASEPNAFTVLHVLYSECRCSRRVAESLALHTASEGVHERVLLVGKDEGLAAKLGARGIDVRVTSVAELLAWHLEAAPLLVVIDPSGAVRYAGGYTERKQALIPRDREIVQAVRAGGRVDPFPLFGCAVSDDLRRTINPLRLP